MAERIYKGGGWIVRTYFKDIGPVKTKADAVRLAKAERSWAKRMGSKSDARVVKVPNPRKLIGAKWQSAKVRRVGGKVQVKINPKRTTCNRKRRNPSGTWAVKTWQGNWGNFSTRKAALDYAKRLRAANRQAGNSGSVKVVKMRAA